MTHAQLAIFIKISWLLFLARPGRAERDCVTAWVLDPKNWTVVEGVAPNLLQCGTFPGCQRFNRATNESFVEETCISAKANLPTTLRFSRPGDRIYKLKIQEFQAELDFCGVPDGVGTVNILCKEQPENGGAGSGNVSTGAVLDANIASSSRTIACKANQDRYIYEIEITINGAGVTLFNPKICTHDDVYNQRIQLANYQWTSNPFLSRPFVGYLQCFGRGAFRCSFSQRPTVFTRIPAMISPESFFDTGGSGTFMLRIGSSNVFVYRGADCEDPSLVTKVISIADFTQKEFKERASLSVFRFPATRFFFLVDVDQNGATLIQCSAPDVSLADLTPEVCGMRGFAENIATPAPLLREGRFILWEEIPVRTNDTNVTRTFGVC